MLLAGALAGMAAEPWSPRDTKAAQALVMDGETGAILFEKNADKPFPPASLAKLMAMEVVFEAVDKHKVRLDQTFPVSDHAWRTGGAPSGASTMFAKLKSQVPLDALIRGVIVQAANDAAIVIAEGMSGSEEAFAGLMNDRARQLGLAGSTFVNPTGLPAPGQKVTARDLATLARHIEEAHPDLYRIYSEPQFEWNKITQRNRNPLLQQELGATGMGTGFTEAGGYSMVGVTQQDGRKTFMILGGLPTIKDRQDDARRMIEWSNSAFRRDVLFDAGARVGKASIYGGLQPEIDIVTHEPLVAFVPTDKPERVKARVAYDWPLRAPIEDGQKVGRIEVTIDDSVSVVHDVFAATKVEQGSFAGRALDAAQELALGWIRAL
ncbi:D-alanyl-D-alanine carboxypeptidase [Aureimonas leprariae]|uniref:serine-type D-Ala-D-Ala carboxypeptidase n=2 Tax=Plantimonas leprariae TaxID=2615207 RepID=A0A7V7PSI3_9HYPH|nr:D-alanyl-D-alanine carboxypeptidase [Aureimonas leprariae]